MTHEWDISATPEPIVQVERATSARPHEGKVLAAVQAHADDVPFYCGGTIAKLVQEGYTAYLIQTTNDDMCGPTTSLGETVLANEREVEVMARALGFRQVFFLGYRNHLMDGLSPLELRARLIFLFRLLKVDTVFTFNPWGLNEENPDHYVTARAVEAARWMAGMDKDYPEHMAAGLEPRAASESYFWVARDGQSYNRVVDISACIEPKIAAISANKAQGPGGNSGSTLKAKLASEGLRLPLLDGDAETADRAYIRQFLLGDDQRVGTEHGLGFAERFYYQGPTDTTRLDEYIRQHAVPSV